MSGVVRSTFKSGFHWYLKLKQIEELGRRLRHKSGLGVKYFKFEHNYRYSKFRKFKWLEVTGNGERLCHGREALFRLSGGAYS